MQTAVVAETLLEILGRFYASKPTHPEPRDAYGTRTYQRRRLPVARDAEPAQRMAITP